MEPLDAISPYREQKKRRVFCTPYAVFSGDESVIHHHAADHHQGTEAVDDDIFPMFFDKVCHLKILRSLIEVDLCRKFLHQTIIKLRQVRRAAEWRV